MHEDPRYLDVNRTPGNPAYEVEYLMTKHNMSKHRVLNLIDKYGRDRKRIERVLSA